jgi:hypothetical protein
VNSIQGPELALCDWQLFSAMRKPLSRDRCKNTGTNSRSCMCPHNRLPDARGERRPAECLDRNLTVLSPGVREAPVGTESRILSLDQPADVPTKDEYPSKLTTLDSVYGSVSTLHRYDLLRRSAQPTAVVHETICEQVHG